LGPISGSHQGQRSKRPHSQAGYMTAPERFAESVTGGKTAESLKTIPTAPGNGEPAGKRL
jgi:hypothetical protein